MTALNGRELSRTHAIKDMVTSKLTGPGGTSYGLGEAGYDIRIKQDIRFFGRGIVRYVETDVKTDVGRFALASAVEMFNMPPGLMGIVHDKSTWARRGLSVFNTVIEPGWSGYLTLELVYHGEGELIIPAGAGIAQVIFHEVAVPMWYRGKYQNQADEPVGPIDSE